jgi:hypothetical protein
MNAIQRWHPADSCHNPCHPSVAGGIKSAPRPTHALPPDIKNEVTSLLEQAKWHGYKMKPWDGDWVAEYRKRAVELQTWLCTSAEDDRKLWNKMPRNPATLCYESCSTLDDKKQFLKYLLNCHPGEVREIWADFFWDSTEFMWKGTDVI